MISSFLYRFINHISVTYSMLKSKLIYNYFKKYFIYAVINF